MSASAAEKTTETAATETAAAETKHEVFRSNVPGLEGLAVESVGGLKEAELELFRLMWHGHMQLSIPHLLVTSLPHKLVACESLVKFSCAGNLLKRLPSMAGFPNLEELLCSMNPLTELPDLSSNSKLRRIACSQCELKELPVLSAHDNLEDITCDENPWSGDWLANVSDVTGWSEGEPLDVNVIKKWGAAQARRRVKGAPRA